MYKVRENIEIKLILNMQTRPCYNVGAQSVETNITSTQHYKTYFISSDLPQAPLFLKFNIIFIHIMFYLRNSIVSKLG